MKEVLISTPRRGGKTTLLTQALVDYSIEHANSICFYNGSNTYATRGAFSTAWNYAVNRVPFTVKRCHDEIRFSNGSRLMFRTPTPQSTKGCLADMLGFDDYDHMDPSTFDAIKYAIKPNGQIYYTKTLEGLFV